MEGKKDKTKPRGLLIFGAPCSGKTTFAEKFGKKFGLAYYNLDEIAEENGFSREQVLATLKLILRTRQTVIIEGGLGTEVERTEVRNVLRNSDYIPSLVWVQTDIATIKLRLKSRYRNMTKAKEVYETAVSELEAPTETEHPIILSGKHTFETQTKHVITGLAELTEVK